MKPVIKALKRGKKRSSGRNNQGKITSFHRGGGHKRSERLILKRRDLLDAFIRTKIQTRVEAKVKTLLYDPGRSSRLALIELPWKYGKPEPIKNLPMKYWNGSLWFMIIAPRNLTDCILLNTKDESFDTRLDFLSSGESLPIESIPLGTWIHNIGTGKYTEGKFARAAGTYAQILEIMKKRVRIRLPSKGERWIPFGTYATIGIVGNEAHRERNLKKAGRSRWLGRRPIVRGVAMNPVDHPHGGGEGKSSGGRPSVTPWGRPTRNWKGKRKKQNPFIN